MAALRPARREEAAAFSVAVMELGALVCTARSPECDACPLASSCAWGAAEKLACDGLLRDGEGTATGARLDAVWPDEVQRARALALLVDDGLVVASAGGHFLP